jgi:hypothetical protein
MGVVCKLIFEELLSGIVVVKPEQSLASGNFFFYNHTAMSESGAACPGVVFFFPAPLAASPRMAPRAELRVLIMFTLCLPNKTQSLHWVFVFFLLITHDVLEVKQKISGFPF